MSDLLQTARSLREAAEAAQASPEHSYEAIDAAGIAWRARGVLDALRGDPALWAEVQRRLTYWHRAGADLARGFDDGQEPEDWPDGAPWPPRPRSGAEWRSTLEWLDMATRLGCDDTGGLRDRIRTALDRADELAVDGLEWLADPDLERDLGERLLAPEIIGRLLELAGVIESGRLAVAVAVSEPAGAKEEVEEPRPINRPSEQAMQAWRLRDLQGKTQAEIAEAMGTYQGQVSRWLKQVKAYLEAGNVLPALEPASKPKAMPPDLLDMGARIDAHTPRQRQRRSED
jgi:hypothetical protein